ncbi:MAG TPA: hypothetical protein VE690_19645 [Rhodopila sp.]|nr:hypothetical protein [Rhodopila sp.]
MVQALLDDLAGISLDSDPRSVAKSGAAQDAAQMAAIEIAATGASAPPLARPGFSAGWRANSNSDHSSPSRSLASLRNSECQEHPCHQGRTGTAEERH